MVESAAASGSGKDSRGKSRLTLAGISKEYAGCVANNRVSLHIRPGCIHALLGENGAGKSTLMKIIGGVVKPDAGCITWEGKTIVLHSPSQARQLGIGMVFQEFALFESLSVLENIALGMDKRLNRDARALAARIIAFADSYGMRIEPDRPLYTLSAGERQRVEILRCLMNDSKLLILDEPTAMLTPLEVDKLFVTLRRLAAEGTSILFVSHKLAEVRSLCDFATVLRNGAVAGSCKPAEVSIGHMLALMAGKDTPVAAMRARLTAGVCRLRVSKLSIESEQRFGVALRNVSFDAKAGEILGIAGVAGNGQAELLAALSGERACEPGSAICLERIAMGKMSTRQRRQHGMAFIPADRLGAAAIAAMSLRENALLTGSRHGLVKFGWLQSTAIEKFVDSIITRFQVNGSGGALAQSLSGGNLQKFVVGREILQQPRCLVAAHPTRGVDRNSAIAIQQALLDLRNQGSAIVVISEDMDELLAISDRICALYRGQLSPAKVTSETGVEQLGRWMAGAFTASELAAA